MESTKKVGVKTKKCAAGVKVGKMAERGKSNPQANHAAGEFRW